jgi:hypothetical protein
MKERQRHMWRVLAVQPNRRIHAVFEREPGWKVMGKRYSLGLFSFALSIAVVSSFAAQIEAVPAKDKSLPRKSSASGLAQRYPWKTRIVTTVF